MSSAERAIPSHTLTIDQLKILLPPPTGENMQTFLGELNSIVDQASGEFTLWVPPGRIAAALAVSGIHPETGEDLPDPDSLMATYPEDARHEYSLLRADEQRWNF